VDVPLAGEQLKVGAWDHAYQRRIDKDRRLADRLGFFYYPTLYVFDGDGELRFTGGWDQGRVETMVKEMLAERPGGAKKSYTLAMPAVGEAGPGFSGQRLTGEAVTLDSLRGSRGTLLVFAKTSCPFTVEALPSIKSAAGEYAAKGVAVIVVNMGEEQEQIRSVYEKDASGVPVVCDRDGQISRKYGVDVTPFYFLLDKDGKIVQRRSYTPVAASGAVNGLLGIAAEPPRYKPTAAG
jgi:peroxiredoxin